MLEDMIALVNAQSLVKKVKFFQNHVAHWAAMISALVALSQTPAYTARLRIPG